MTAGLGLAQAQVCATSCARRSAQTPASPGPRAGPCSIAAWGGGSTVTGGGPPSSAPDPADPDPRRPKHLGSPHPHRRPSARGTRAPRAAPALAVPGVSPRPRPVPLRPRVPARAR